MEEEDGGESRREMGGGKGKEGGDVNGGEGK